MYLFDTPEPFYEWAIFQPVFFKFWAIFSLTKTLDLREQYRYEQQTQPEVWKAFIRRIHKVIKFLPDGTQQIYDTQDYLSHSDRYIELPKIAYKSA